MIFPVVVFALTIALILIRPRGWHEALWPAGAATALLIFGFIEFDRVVATLEDGAAALGFLFALLVYGAFLEHSGLFDWAALHAARSARGCVARLFRNLFFLAALTTITLSLDTTAVLLTPIVLTLAARLGLSATPFLVMLIFVANAGSLLLPVSNLTNILFAERFALSAAHFLRWMALPQLLVLVLLYAALSRFFRESLRQTFDLTSLPEPETAVHDRFYFQLSLFSLPLIGLGYVIAPLLELPPSAPLLGASFILFLRAAWMGRLDRRFVLNLPWGLFPLVFGLFILVRFVGDSGLLALSISALHKLEPGARGLLLLSSLIGLATNLGNNLPIALFIQDVFGSAERDAVILYAALIGANIGPLLTPLGSLATLLILSMASRAGVALPTRSYLRLAALLTPLLFLFALFALLFIEARSPL